MKRFMLVSLVLFFAMGLASAQGTLTSKKGIPILPQAGDFAIGMNAVTMLEYLGNTFNGTMNNSVAFDFVDNDHYIFGKYYKTDLLAYRFSLRVGHTRTTTGMYVMDDLDTTFKGQVLDKHTDVNTSVILGIGMEKRKGIYRIQGFYGADLMLGIFSGSDIYSYGNEITKTNLSPTSYDFGTNLPMPGVRVVNFKDGMEAGLGVRAFVGMEYFIFPKLSLGGEFGWGIWGSIRTDSKTTAEYWDATEKMVVEEEHLHDMGSLLRIDTDNMGGMIKLLFHF